MESILTSIKRLLGITEEYDHFDDEIIVHINSVFMILNQLGVGPDEGFMIEDESATWEDFFTGRENLAAVRSYIYLKVKILFEGHTLGASMIESLERMVKEFEWRLNVSGEEKIQNE